jgi:Domain of unknown function (DUF1857)
VNVHPGGIKPFAFTADTEGTERFLCGLVMKAENAIPFVPGMESCIVLERNESSLVREVVFRGEHLKEGVTFFPPVVVYFERIEGEEPGWITNTISESEGASVDFHLCPELSGYRTGFARGKTAWCCHEVKVFRRRR